MEPTLQDGDLLLVWWGARPRARRMAVVRLAHRPLSVKRLAFRSPVSGGDGEGWWMERDNPEAGVDSWQIGAVPAHDVLAVVLCRIAPFRLLPRRRVEG